MSTIQKKRPPQKTTKNETFENVPQTVRSGDGADAALDTEPLEPVFTNQYAISCGADEYIMPSLRDMTVAELRSYIQMNRPNGMTLDNGMPCFINGELASEENKVLSGNLRIEFTKKAGVKGNLA